MIDPNRLGGDSRYGSARFATEANLHRAGLFGAQGLPFGFYDNRLLRFSGDGARLTFSGAGGGKLTTQLAFTLCLPNNMPMLILDPRGELGAISQHRLAPQGIYGYYWNPVGLCGLPQHRCNPLAHLNLDNPNFHGDAQVAASSLIPISVGGNGKYFEQRSQEWVGAFMKHLAECRGGVSFPKLYDLINAIEGNPNLWADTLEAMMASRFLDVQRAAHEMLVKQQDTPKEFGAIVGELYAHFAFLNDPALRDSLHDGDVSLSDLIGNTRIVRLHLNVPSEYLNLWSPVIRVMFSTVMALKARQPNARRVLLLVDEAGQLGRAEFLIRAFTFGRGAGLIPHALFQDAGQISRTMGRDAVQSFIASGAQRQFFGVRDYTTAKLVSDMLGQQTLEFDNNGQQDDAAHRSHQQHTAYLNGDDPVRVAQDYHHYAHASERSSYMQRPLMSPDEILNMPEDQQIVFLSGKDLPPILCNRYRYFDLRMMAGLYLPNPYHPPSNRVQVKTRFGTKWLNVSRVPVPDKYRQFPQYQNGTALQISGYPL